MISKINHYIQKNPENITIATLFAVALSEIIRIHKDFTGYWELNSLKAYDSLLYFFPSIISDNSWTMYTLALLFVLSIIGFYTTYKKRFFFILNFLSFFLFISFYLRHISFTDHRAGIPTFFYFICMVPILLEQKKWSDFIWKSLFVGVVIFYFLTGLHKLLVSGPGWANGTSLQLWFFYDSVSLKEFVWPIMRDVKLAKKVQAVIFLLEIATPFALTKTFRPFWFVGIILFHICLELTFGYQYFFVGVLTTLTTYIIIKKDLSFFTVPSKSSSTPSGKSLRT
nr:hypothetical protein BHI3_12380 [Bacteriovorax sp. HI3]